MEIRKLNDVQGVVVASGIPEGRMVLLTENTLDSYDFGSRDDLPAVRLPDTDAEGDLAIYLVGFPVDNSSLPIYQPYPSYDWALRQGFDQTSNVPFTAQVYLTHPSNMEGQTIPSGSLALAYLGGVFTFKEGEFVAGAYTPGAYVAVADTATDGAANAGKPKLLSGGDPTTEGVVGVVLQYDSSEKELTVRLFDH